MKRALKTFCTSVVHKLTLYRTVSHLETSKLYSTTEALWDEQ